MNLRGGNNGNRGSAASISASKKRATSGEEELQHLIDLAAYEIETDAYRGLQTKEQQQKQNDNGEDGQEGQEQGEGQGTSLFWNQCKWNATPHNYNGANSKEAAAVLNVCHCACPSLLSWTQQVFYKQQQQQRKRKRKRSDTQQSFDEQYQQQQLIGNRPPNDLYSCQCDYNPTCLATLGGIVNEILNEAAQDVLQNHQQEWEQNGSVTSTTKTAASSTFSTSQNNTNNFQNNNDADTNSIIDVDIASETQTGDGDTNTVQSTTNDDASQQPEQTQGQQESDNIITSSPIPHYWNHLDPNLRPRKRLRRPSLLDIKSPKDLFAHDCNIDFSQDHSPLLFYSKDTSDDLRRVRIRNNVALGPIQSYVYHTLNVGHEPPPPREKNKMTLDQYTNRLIDWHESLLFVDPIHNDNPNNTTYTYVDNAQGIIHTSNNNDDNNNNHHHNNYYCDNTQSLMPIAIPPGIKNLGATCYLNTQLQCLAQNLAFLKGIFSWRSVSNSNNGMNSVMSKMQYLLAQMTLGGDRTLSTLQFSNALGLEHDEQQDPNEFARLLFERMDESFQQCSQSKKQSLDKSKKQSRNTGVNGKNTNPDDNDKNDNNDNNGNDNYSRDASDEVNDEVDNDDDDQDDDGDDDDDDDADLSNLLKRIFHGVTTYRTTCMTCNATSDRREGFMDLNLPIVQIPAKSTTNPTSSKTSTPSSSKKKNNNNNNSKNKKDNKDSDQPSIKDSLGSSTSSKHSQDTNVQYCLDQYLGAERLEGDNQYFCSACNCKRDAERVLTFSELPPVLNVQLSRYVFDIKNFVKKKLSDKVLLPTILHVPHHDSQVETQKYILCAVMRHQGNSAYRGHYVAEAMDWLTGLWFEFNDETVQLLPHGPSCSYCPLDNNDTESLSSQSSDVGGSQDAYNMYYVEESFLQSQAVESLTRRHLLLGRSMQKVSTKFSKNVNPNDVLMTVAKQRADRYSILSEQCFSDWRRAERWNRRRHGIRKFMFSDISSLDVSSSDGSCSNNTGGNKNHPLIWVEALPLSKYLSFDPTFDEEFLAQDGPILRHSRLLCDHNCLHPRVARRGKVLPKPIYDGYVEMLEAERNLLCSGEGINITNQAVTDSVISPDTNLFCKPCTESYRDDLSHKYTLASNLKLLYEDLDTKSPDCSLECTNPEDIDNNGEYAYAISKTFVTRFRRRVAALMKTLVIFGTGSDASGEECLEGLDGLDLYSATSPRSTLGGNDDELDQRVNGSITCHHGNCNKLNSKRHTRYIFESTWMVIKEVFPLAIEHARKRRLKNDDVEENVDDIDCPMCVQEHATEERFKACLTHWATTCRQSPDLKSISVDVLPVPRASVVHNFTSSSSHGCRLVHALDIKNWKNAIVKLENPEKVASNGTIDEFIQAIEEIAFPNQHKVILDFERHPVERLMASLHSLSCGEHRLAFQSAVFVDQGEEEAEKDDAQKKKQQHDNQKEIINYQRIFSNHVAILSDVEYKAYIASLARLLDIISYDGQVPIDDDTDKTTDHPPKHLQEIQRAADIYHPVIKAVSTMGNDEQVDRDQGFEFMLDTSDRLYWMRPKLCDSRHCKNEFVPYESSSCVAFDGSTVNDTSSTGDIPSNISDIDMVDVTPKKSGAGFAAADPILVESDLEEDAKANEFDLRVYEVKSSETIEAALTALQTVSALPFSSPGQESSGDGNSVRRSSRKRKSRFPSGALLRESQVPIAMYYNLAALRLSLYEKCEVKICGNILFLVLSLKGGLPPKTQQLSYEWSTKQLQDIVQDMISEIAMPDLDVDPRSDLLLLYQDDDSNTASNDASETIMDSLLETSNIDSNNTDDNYNSQGNNKNNNNNKDGRKRNRPAERGFSGTLLSSSSVRQDQDGNRQKQQEQQEGNENKSNDNSKKQAKFVNGPKNDVGNDNDNNNLAILSDSSEDELLDSMFPSKLTRAVSDLRSGSPSSPPVPEPRKANNSKKATRNEQLQQQQQPSSQSQVIDDVSSDNDSDRGGQKSSSSRRRDFQGGGVPPPRAISQDTQMFDDEEDDFVQTLADEVSNAIGSDKANETNCWKAAHWARQQYPNASSVRELVDTAFAKYVELDDENS